MHIAHLRLINFRNYEYLDLPLHPGINLFYGGNAQGKTNLLEAVYYTGRGRTFKNNPDKELIRLGERSAYVRSTVLKEDLTGKQRQKIVEFKLSRVDPKRVRINEVELDSLKELTNQFELVLFAPQDLDLVEGGPENRRLYLDEILKDTDPSYRENLTRFRQVLSQRNSLLKQGKGGWFGDQLKVLDLQFSKLQASLVRKRRDLVDQLALFLETIHGQLTDGREKTSISYLCEGDEDPDQMMTTLKKARSRDLRFGSTGPGPQKDDLDIRINGGGARKFASRGQARTLTLSLKLAQVQVIEEINRTKPILLLDDVFSELDASRSQYLVDSIQDFQTLMTTNDPNQVGLTQARGAFYRVHAGQVEKTG